jgi:ribosomal protein S18 acetylase RimI-like enzyme
MKYLEYYKLFESSEFICKEVYKSKECWDFISRYLNVISYDDYINNENLYQVGIFLDGEMVGLRIFRMKDGKIHLNYSAVSEEYRGKGLNVQMFKKIEEIGKSNGVTMITSNVRVSNKSSLNSLLSCGFSINDRVDLSYPDGEKKIALFKRI